MLVASPMLRNKLLKILCYMNFSNELILMVQVLKGEPDRTARYFCRAFFAQTLAPLHITARTSFILVVAT
jgi:hypothetical protein